MAKVKEEKPTLSTVKTETPADAAKAAKKKAAKAVVKANVKYIGLKDAAPAEVKMPLQCKQIMAILNAAPAKTMLREALLAEMTKVVVTRQPIERILGFYQPRLISSGFLKIEVEPKPVKVKEAKAAPEATAKA